LGDAIQVRGMDAGGFAQAAKPLGVFALGQMAPSGARAHGLAGGGDFEPLGHGLFRFDAFGTSHKLFKRTCIIRLHRSKARGNKKILGYLWQGRKRGCIPNLFHGVLNALKIRHFARSNRLEKILESLRHGPFPMFDVTVNE
jgi:hypothetical protein